MTRTISNSKRSRITAWLVAGIAAVVVVPTAQAAKDEKFIPGYTDVPNALRYKDTSEPQWLQALKVRSAGMDRIHGLAGETFIPGFTDVPNALRYADDNQPQWMKALQVRSEGMDRTYAGERFVPGHTDVPNVLRYTDPSEQAIVAARLGATNPVVTVTAPGDEFSWSSAGIGAAITGGVAVLLAAAALVMVRRRDHLAISH